MAIRFDSRGPVAQKPKKPKAPLFSGATVTQQQPVSGPAYTPPASTPAPLPVDPGYLQTIGGLAQRRDNTIAGLQGERTSALADYGYTGSFDASGGLTGGLAFDPANPFSRAALLQKSYQQSKAGNANSAAARGQFFSGSLQNAQDNADSGYQQGTDSLQKQLISYLAGLQGQQSAAGTDYEIGAGQALGSATQNAPSNPLYTPTVAAAATPQLAARKVTKTVGGVNYYTTASGKLAPIPKGAPIIK